MDHVLDNAVARCPFLAKLALQEGPDFARCIALNPCAPVAQTANRRPVLEELDDYTSSFRLFHGHGGLVPLLGAPSIGAPTQQAPPAPPAPVACPAHAAASIQKHDAQPMASRRRSCGPGRPLPLATMSLSFGDMPDFAKFFRAFQQQHMQQRRPQQPRPARQPQPSAGESAGQCPMRKVLGPLAPVIFNPKGHLQCPEVIVKARAALAATKPVRELRPQQLGVKLLAVGATTAAVNVPCGMVREHTEKFSFGWFVAVHASIPFIAMLRKAVIMPKYAILFTIATAIAGQAMGAKLERKRLSSVKSMPAMASASPVAVDSLVSPLTLQPHTFSMERPPAKAVRVSKAVCKHTATAAASSYHKEMRSAHAVTTAIIPHAVPARG